MYIKMGKVYLQLLQLLVGIYPCIDYHMDLYIMVLYKLQ